MIQQDQLTAKEIRDELQAVAKAHLSLHAHDYVVRDEMVYDVPIEAASENISSDAVCKELEQGASGNRIREWLNAQLREEELSHLEEEINAALAERLPRSIFEKELEAAIDEAIALAIPSTTARWRIWSSSPPWFQTNRVNDGVNGAFL